MESADIVVLGGGVVGMSIAWHLTRRGITDVVVVERGRRGSGSTGRGTGVIRQQFTRGIEAAMARESVAFWSRFMDETGVDLAFNRCGHLYLITSAADLARKQRDAAMQRRLGIPTEILSPDEIARRVPGMRRDGILAGSFCAEDGRAVGLNALKGFADGAVACGARILEDTEVTGIRVVSGAIAGVQTTAGEIATRVVINAAGPWAAAVGDMVGVTIPVRPRRMNQYVLTGAPDLPPDMPVMADLGSTLLMAPDAAGILLGKRQYDAPGDSLEVDWDFLPTVQATAAERFPQLAGARLDRAWAGFTEVSPDSLGMIGAAAQVAGFYYANGFSGHGFMLSPATGRLIADLVADGAVTDLDLSQLSIERFGAKS